MTGRLGETLTEVEDIELQADENTLPADAVEDRKFTPEERDLAAEAHIREFGRNYSEATTNDTQVLRITDGNTTVETNVVYGIMPGSPGAGRVEITEQTYTNGRLSKGVYVLVQRIKFGSAIISQSWTDDFIKKPVTYTDGPKANAQVTNQLEKTGKLMGKPR